MTPEFRAAMTKGCPPAERGTIPPQFWPRTYTHPGVGGLALSWGFGGRAVTWAELQGRMASHGWRCTGAFRFETGAGDHATMDSTTGALVVVVAAPVHVGPTAPGRYVADCDGERVELTAYVTPAGALVWEWDDMPGEPEDAWTPSWPCSPAVAAGV